MMNDIKEVRKFSIKEEKGRLDKVLTDLIPEESRAQIQQWIESGLILVNEEEHPSKYKVKSGDKITVHIPKPISSEIEPENIPIDILYEDQDLAVIDKPSGMVVHPAPGHYSGTLVNALMYHMKDLSGINGELRPGIVHRIDKDTSGALVIAKNDYAHRHLSDQLKDHSVMRHYQAIVHGGFSHESGTIDAPIGRDPKDRKKYAVNREGKHAITHFSVLEDLGNYTLVEASLETGRTHQIRVHFNYINHPIAGDPIYGPKNTLTGEGQYLHAKNLGFIHPRTEKFLSFECPLPDVFQCTLKELRKNL